MLKKLGLLATAFVLGLMIAPKSGKDTRSSVKKWVMDKKKGLKKEA